MPPTTSSGRRPSLRPSLVHLAAAALVAVAVATCSDDKVNGPSHNSKGYFGFRPVTHLSAPPSSFGIVIDSVHIRLTLPPSTVVLDTTAYFPADSSNLHLSLAVPLEQASETLSALIELKAAGVVVFSATQNVEVVNGPPGSSPLPTVNLAFVGPGTTIAHISIVPKDTAVALGDSVRYSATAVDSSAAPVTQFYVGWKSADTTLAKINATGLLRAPNHRGSVKIIGTTPTGIADTTLVTFVPTAKILEKLSGDLQTGTVAQSPALPITVISKAADSIGVAGVAVHFSVLTGGGSVTDSVVLTDTSGHASTPITLGTGAGPQKFVAKAGTFAPDTFTITAVAGAPSAIAIHGGNAQTDTVGIAMPAPFSARVTDAYGNAVTGAKVAWLRTAGGGTVATDTTASDTAGVANVGYTLGPTPRVDSVKATLVGTPAFITFTVTGIPPAPAAIAITSGDAQTDTVNKALALPLIVTVTGSGARPVANTKVAFSVKSGSGTFGGPAVDTITTDTLGHAQAPFTLGTLAGTDSVQAKTVAGGFTAVFHATALAGAPSAIAVQSGNGQTDTISTALPLPLTVKVTDAFANAVTGAKVFWTRVGGGTLSIDSSFTAAGGLTQISYTLGAAPRVDSITATLSGTAATAKFTATVVPPAPAAISISAGDAQSDTVTKALPAPLVVMVTGAGARPVAGTKVAFSVKSGTGNFGGPAVDTVTTDTLGHAQAPFTLGTLAGTDSVQATTVTGGFSAVFHLHAVTAAPSVIAAQSGDAQTDTVSTALPAPIVVKVTDAFGNPVNAVKVFWTRIGGGMLSRDSSFTAATGLTQVNYTLGATPRTDSVVATIAGTGFFARMTAIAVPPAPSAISIAGGSGQTDSVGRTLPQPFIVMVTGAGARPVAGAKVALSVKTGSGTFGTFTVDTVTTDTLGHASASFTLGTAAGTDSVLARTVVGGFSVTFSANAIPLAPSALVQLSGNGQTDTISTALPAPFLVKATDSFGNAVTGAKVVFTVATGNGLFGGLTIDTITTAANGQASVTLTTGAIVKPDTALATLLGTAQTARFVTTVVPPAASAIAILNGNAQIDTVGKVLGKPFQVQVTGAGARPVAGAQVVFSAKVGTALFGGKAVDTVATDTLGDAQAAITLGTVAQADSFQATVLGTALPPAVIGATALPAAPSLIAIISGNAQSDTIGKALPLPLVVKVTDANGNAVTGAKVAWSVHTGAGLFSPSDTTATNALGQASATFTLPAAAGLDSLRGTLVGTAAFVNFTATGTSGAPSGVTVVSGAAQTDTVGVPLPLPLVVRVADGSNNPVAGAKIFWTRTSGTGTVSADSTVTDAAGQTQITFTLGTVVGADSVKAALFGGPNVMFGMAGTAGAAKTIAATGGNNQTGTAGAVLASPLTVKVTDAHGNAVSGVSVTWAVTQGGGSLGGITATTDATGTSTVGQWTMGAVSGTNLATATVSGLTGSPVQFTAVSLPIGTTKTWTGALGTAWNTAGSWSPAGVPINTDNVFIPVSAPSPSLTANASVGGVQLEAGATLTLNANDTLTALGTILVPATAQVSGAGQLGLNGSTEQVSGTVANLVVTNTAQLAAATHVTGGVSITGSGALTVNGKALTVGGNVSLAGSGQLVMTNAADSVDVTGSYTANGASSGANLSAGKLVLRGAFTQLSSVTDNFAPTSTHTTIFAGSSAQTVSFASQGPTSSRFANVTFANPAGVTLSSDFTATGLVTATGNVNGTAHSAILESGLADATSDHWHVDTTGFFGGGALTLPDSMSGFVSFGGTGTTLSKAFKLNGFMVVGGGSFAPAGHTLTVAGTSPFGALSVVGSATLVMTNAADSVDVAGPFSVSSITSSSGLLTAGKLVLRGSLSQTTGSTLNFSPSGTHQTIFAGNTAQAVIFASPGAGSAHFQDVTFADPAGVTFASNAAVNGTATVTAGQVTGPVRSFTLAGGLVDAGFGWHPDTTVFTGNSTLFPDSMTGSIHFQGADTLAHSFTALGQLTVDGGGVLTVNGHVLTADSTLSVTQSALLRMTSATDSVDVHGGFSVGSITGSSGAMTAGTLVLRGPLTQTTGSTQNFSASGTHKTVFAGSAAQTATFAAASLGGSHFQDVTFNNAAGVTFASPLAVAGTATILSGNVTGTTSHVATLAGNLVDATNSRWHVDTTYFTGSPALPDSFSGSVHFQGTTTLAKSLKILGTATVDGGGVFTLGGHPFTVTGAFSVAQSGLMVMTNAADSMDVGGAFSVSTITGSSGDLTAGTLVLRGSFTQTTGSTQNFAASGTHRTIFAGAGAQSVSFASPGITSGRFQDLLVDNPSGVSLTSAAATAGSVTLRRGALTGAGHGFTIGLDLTDTSNVSWKPDTTIFAGAPTTLPDSIQSVVRFQGATNLAKALKIKGAAVVEGSGQLQPTGHPLTVTGALSITGGSRFIMSNVTDSVDVGGLFSATSSTSSTGDLIQGVLFLRGGFTQSGSSSTSFAPSGSHRVRFGGGAAQSLSFTNPTTSSFNLVEFADAGGVSATSDFTVASTATMVTGSLTGTGHGATLAAALQDPSGNGWRMDTTTFTGTPGALPDSIHSVVHFQAPVTLAKALRVVGPLFLDGSNGVLTAGGFPLTVTGAMRLNGSGQLKMLSNADSVDVGGFVTASTVSGFGLDTAGVLVVRGGFHQLASGSSTAFAPSGTHRTRMVTGSVDSISFANPGFAASHFDGLEFTAGSGTIILGSDVQAGGAIVKGAGASPTLQGAGTVLQANGLDVDGLVLDHVRLIKSGLAQVARFDSVTFQNQDSTADQFTLVEAGSATAQTFNGIVFSNPVKFGTGHYIAVADSLEDGHPITLNMNRSTPLYGGSFTGILSGFDPPSVRWSGLAFAQAPVGGVTGILLAPTRVALVGPLGDTLTNVPDTVTALISTNPVGGTLTGVTNVPLVNGIATFDSLTITGVGTGYVLEFGANGFQPIFSTLLNIDIQIPLGINAVWRGGTDSLWTNPANWQAGVVPDSTSNVYVPFGMPHSPYLGFAGLAHVNRLQIAPGATFKADTLSSVVIDSSVDNSGTITGGGIVDLTKTGTVRGTFNTVVVSGAFSVVPGSTLLANRSLTVAGVTAKLDLNGTNSSTNGSLTVTNGGLLVMTHANDSLNVAGDATFSGGNELGFLTAGRILLQGNFAQYGSSQAGPSPTAFAALPGHIVELMRGSGIQTVHFANPDTIASHFGSLIVSGADSVVFDTLAIAAGNVSVTGANAAVQSHDTLAVVGNVSTVMGSRLWLNALGIAGTLSVSGAYHVGTTGFVGTGQTIPALPYDSIQVRGTAALGASIVANRLYLNGPKMGGFLNMNGRKMTVTGDVVIDTAGALVMHASSDTLFVGGNFSPGGMDSTGKLIAGVIDIGGDFTQPVKSAAFLPSGNHIVRFNGGTHQVTFGSPGIFALGFVPSSFNHLELIGGASVNGLSGMIVTGNLTLAGSTLADSARISIGDGSIAARVSVTGNVSADATSTLAALWLSVAGTLTAPTAPAQYAVETTGFTGAGQLIPALPYQDVNVTGTASAATDLTVQNNLTIQNGTNPGTFAPAGHAVTVIGTLTTADQGALVMTNTADSVDVGSGGAFVGANFGGGSEAGLLTAGTLVVQGNFNQNQGLGSSFATSDSAFYATGTHRTIFVGGVRGNNIQYATLATQFNKLNVTGAGGATISSVNTVPFVVADSLQIKQGGLSDGGRERLVALGPVVADSQSFLFVDTLEVHGTLSVPVDTNFGANVTRFFGTNQAIPSNLSYVNVDILGTVHPIARFEAQDTLNVLSGELDVNGQLVVADSQFNTNGTGTLKMTNAADSVLVFGSANFNGGSTAGLLTAGYFITPIIRQGFIASDQSFAASGNHHLQIDDSPNFTGTQISFATPGAAASHPQILNFNIAEQLDLATSLYVADTLYAPSSDGSVQGASGAVLTAAGPLVQSGFMNMAVDTLVLLDPNPIQGSSTPSFWSPTVTRFAGTNQAIRDTVAYHTLEITGSAHINFHASTDAIVVNGGNLTINSGNIGTNGDFTTENGGILTMDSVNSRLFVGGNATFGGGNTGGTLKAGEIQVAGNFFEQGNSNAADFSPLGTKVTLNGGSPQVVHFAQPGGSYFRDLDVVNSGGILAIGNVLVTGNYNSNQSISGDSLVVFGNFVDTNFSPPPAILLKALMLAGPMNTNAGPYNVTRTHFLSTNAIPNLPYTDLVINAPIVSIPSGLSINNLYVAGPGTPLYQGTSGSASLSLPPGTLISADTLDIEGGSLTVGGGRIDLAGNLHTALGGTLTMNQASDSVTVGSNAIFDGNSTAGQMTDGTLIISGSLLQGLQGGDAQAFAPSGNHLTEFVGPNPGVGTRHLIQFANPTTSTFANMREDYPDTLIINNGQAIVAGMLTITHGFFVPGLDIKSGSGNGLLTFGGSNIESATFDTVTAQFTDQTPMVAFDSVVFNAPTDNFTQFAASGPDGDQVTISATTFTVIGAGNGEYITATNTSGTGSFTVQALNPNLGLSEFNAHVLGDAFSLINWLVP